MTENQLRALQLGRQKGIKRNRPKGIKYTLHKINPTSYKKGDPRVLNNLFSKNRVPWNKDLKGVHTSISSEFKKGANLGERNNKWLGEKVGYQNLHRWLNRNFKKTGICQNCKTVPDRGDHMVGTDWANISHLYKRSREDFIELCSYCHRNYDLGKISLEVHV